MPKAIAPDAMSKAHTALSGLEVHGRCDAAAEAVLSAPRATMRLQLHRDFTFEHARSIVPYAAALGVSHLYLSPILVARAGSTHGYDVIDHSRVNPELGGEDGIRRLAAAAHRSGIGLVVDIVPNHMAVGGDDNPCWLDLLKHGPASSFANLFDIDWEPDRGRTRILAPFLDKPYGEALAAGEIQLSRNSRHGWVASYSGHLFPIRSEDAERLDAEGISTLSEHDASTASGRARLHTLLEHQHYRLAWSNTANDLINWRRFFEVTELAALRADRPDVFEATHATLLRLYEEGVVDAFRVDHVDGIADPKAYCRKLRAELVERQRRRPAGSSRRVWLTVEKILACDEELDPAWQVDGTTGYDFLSQVGLLLHDPRGLAELERSWSVATGRTGDFRSEEIEARREILRRRFSAPLDSLVRSLAILAESDLVDRDRPPAALRRCLIEIIAHMRVYRSYGACEDAGPEDSRAVRAAIAEATGSCWPSDRNHLPALERWLTIAEGETVAPEKADALRRFEQLSAPVAAKAVEDTAFYRYGALLSRNDVGCDPGQAASGIDGFHRACRQRAASFPLAMLATATHDHKRGEDVRARLAVLSERPEQWLSSLERWRAELAAWRRRRSADAIQPGDELMLLQMIVGAWPLTLHPGDRAGLENFAARLEQWQHKALREAKLDTAWDGVDAAYEALAKQHLHALLLDPALAACRHELFRFADALGPAGALNGLAQTMLRLTTPGIPDLYQGCEFWDQSLVDPDNRTAVDFSARIAALGDADWGELKCDWRSGRIKQALITRMLALRTQQPALFASGCYRPLRCHGALGEHVLAFARGHDAQTLLVAVPRLMGASIDADLAFGPDAWNETAIALPADLRGHGWQCVFGGRPIENPAQLPCGSLFREMPVAALLAT